MASGSASEATAGWRSRRRHERAGVHHRTRHGDLPGRRRGDLLAGALAGESGLAPITSFDAKALPVAGAGEVPEETLRAIRERLPEEYAGEGERRVLFALDAAQNAMTDAGIFPGD